MAHHFPSRRWSSHPAPTSTAAKKARALKSPLPAQNPPAQSQNPANIGCLLLPQFSVWAARKAHPALAAAPLLIHRNGKVLASSADALSSGVRIGWALQRAQSLCPRAQMRAQDLAEEVHVWEEVLASLYDLTPRLESTRPGLVFFETPSHNSVSWLSTMAALAKQVKAWQAQSTIACDRATAELAAYRVAPGVVRPVKNARGFLSRTPITNLCELGLSAVAAERLQWFGFDNVADLTRVSREQIACQFADPAHRKDTALLWRFACAGTPAGDAQPVQSYQPPPVRFSRFVFAEAATCTSEWENALGDAVQQVTAQLGGMSAGALTLCLQTKTGPRRACKILREAVSSPRTLVRFASDLMSALAQNEKGASDRIEVQALEIRLSRLSGAGRQDTLFDTRRFDNSPQRTAPPTLLAALHNLESRHAGMMCKWKVRDIYAPLPEERFTLIPALDEAS